MELAPTGDGARIGPVIVDGRSGLFCPAQPRQEGLMSLTPRPRRGWPSSRGLVEKVDVLVENYAPGVIGRLGPRLRGGESDQSQAGDVLDFRLWGRPARSPTSPVSTGWARPTQASLRWGAKRMVRPYSRWWPWATSPPERMLWARSAPPLLYRERTGRGQHLGPGVALIPMRITMRPAFRCTA